MQAEMRRGNLRTLQLQRPNFKHSVASVPTHAKVSHAHAAPAMTNCIAPELLERAETEAYHHVGHRQSFRKTTIVD